MAEEFKAIDFKNLFFDSYNLGSKDDILVKFPILANYKVFRARLQAALPIVKVFKYISFVFDKNTPLMRLNDPMKIRYFACVLAEFDMTKDGKFDQLVEDMVYSRNEKINEMIISYCVITGGEDWATMTAFTEALRRENLKLLDDKTKDKDRIASLNMIKTLRKEIGDLKKYWLQAENDTLLLKSLYIFTEADDLGLTCEAYAEKLELSQNKL